MLKPISSAKNHNQVGIHYNVALTSDEIASLIHLIIEERNAWKEQQMIEVEELGRASRDVERAVNNCNALLSVFISINEVAS